MRSRWNLIIVLVYMGIALGVLSYMAVNMIGPCRPFAGCMSMNVEFSNASGLLHSNDVRVAGVKAGQVTSLKNQGGMAVVTIQMEPKYLPVYRDAHAIVRPKNLLGETYVEIDRGSPSAGEFREGQTLALDHTITPVQIDEVLNALDPDTRTKLQIVINSLGEATAARGQDLNLSTADLKRISADLAVTSTSLNQEKDNIDALLVQFDLIQQTAADDHAQLAQTLQDWNTVSVTMQKKAATFADAITHLNHILGVLDQGLSPNAQPLHGAVAALPAAISDASINTPNSNIPGTPNPNGGFLGISSTIQELFIKKPANCTVGPCGNTLQDGMALFPRLAQTMLGVNTCDMTTSTPTATTTSRPSPNRVDVHPRSTPTGTRPTRTSTASASATSSPRARPPRVTATCGGSWACSTSARRRVASSTQPPQRCPHLNASPAPTACPSTAGRRRPPAAATRARRAAGPAAAAASGPTSGPTW